MTADRLQAKLEAGKMLDDDEMEELKTAAADSAAATADRLAAKLAAGKMLDDHELEELKSSATAASAINVKGPTETSSTRCALADTCASSDTPLPESGVSKD